MNIYDASEYAYKNGYEAGVKDSAAELKSLSELFNREKEKNMILNHDLHRMQEQLENFNGRYCCVVKMNDNCLVYARTLEDYDNLIGDISAAGIKEFAKKLTDIICEKLEQSMDHPDGDNYFITDVYTDIDNLLKEMKVE